MIADLPPFAQVLADWLLRVHDGAGVPVRTRLWESNRGQAVSFDWTEQIWAWLWLETDPVQFACGWPGGSKVLNYPYVCRQLARHVGEQRFTKARLYD